LRGLKAALVERSRARGVCPSDLVRALLAEQLGRAGHLPLIDLRSPLLRLPKIACGCHCA